MGIRTLVFAAALLLTTTAQAQIPANVVAAVASPLRPATDTERDAARKPALMLDFAQVKPGSRVVDFLPGHGYFTRLFALAVKPGGSVVAVVPPEAAKRDAEGAAMIAALAADPQFGDIKVVNGIGDAAIGRPDIFWTAQNYHDLHNLLTVEQVIEINEAIFKMLKPGGVYVIVDHVAAADTRPSVANSLHRIDPETVKGEVEAAGFVFEAASNALANPADPHTANVFDPSIRGKTDQFMLRFRKPK